MGALLLMHINIVTLFSLGYFSGLDHLNNSCPFMRSNSFTFSLKNVIIIIESLIYTSTIFIVLICLLHVQTKF